MHWSPQVPGLNNPQREHPMLIPGQSFFEAMQLERLSAFSKSSTEASFPTWLSNSMEGVGQVNKVSQKFSSLVDFPNW